MSDGGSEQTLSEDNNHIINENANTDPNNASFTIDDVVHYGELYDKCVHKNSIFIYSLIERLRNSLMMFHRMVRNV